MRKEDGSVALEELQSPLDLEDHVAVVKSLDGFAERMNEGGLREVFEAYRKPNRILPVTGKLVARVHTGRHTFFDAGVEGLQYYSDADYALTVGVEHRTQPPLTFGIAGFYAGNRLRRYDDIRREKFGKDSIVAVQLQGPSLRPNTQATIATSRGRRMYQAYRTEFVLLTLLKQWAQEAGLNDLYMLPAHKNKWMPTEEMVNRYPEKGNGNLRKRLTERYDVTAKRFGFEKGEKGFFHLPLKGGYSTGA